eukprot:m.53403 g.53403  ORF g.53403 m.53403 type:complete len:194 (-) comp13160_c0_seq1:566-1147(-)
MRDGAVGVGEMTAKKNLEPLAALATDAAEKLVHSVVDSVVGRAGPRYADYGKGWSLAEWTDVRNGLSELVREVGRTDAKDVAGSCEKHGLPSKVTPTLTECIAARKTELSDALLRETASIASPVLTNFDWKLQMVMGSDKISSVRQSVVQLDLQVKQLDGSHKHTQLEMDEQELDAFIAKLEEAHQTLSELST